MLTEKAPTFYVFTDNETGHVEIVLSGDALDCLTGRELIRAVELSITGMNGLLDDMLAAAHDQPGKAH